MIRRTARRLLPLPLVGALTCLTGCFDIEEVIQLERDLSGEASVTMNVDLEAMVTVMAQLKKQMQGDGGELTEEELQEAKEEFLAQNKSEQQAEEIEKKRAELKENLPEGVELKRWDVVNEDLGISVDMTFAFDHVSKLSEIEIPKDEGARRGGPGPGNPVDRPFERLVVEEDGDTVRIHVERPINPTENEGKGGGPGRGGPPGMEEMVEDVMKDGLRVAYRFEAPFDVVEHNATSEEEGALHWEYGFEELDAMSEDDAAVATPDVTYRRRATTGG